jgi:hypothetical protein
MRKILQFIGISAALSFGSLNAQTYLSENFETPFSGTPSAPTGWTQTRINLLGDGIPDAGGSGEKDWERITNTGLAVWTATWTGGVFPNAAVSGSNVITIDDFDFGGTGTALGTRRVESPLVNLAASTNPYVRFFLFSGTTNSYLILRVMASLDGGATYSVIANVAPNADVTSFGPATPWQKINVQIPSAFKVSNAKFAFELTNTYFSSNFFIDDYSIEEFTPTTITSFTSGNWSNPATWVGGVVPTADNHVVIAATHSVTIDVITARNQNMTVDGRLSHLGTTSLHQIFGNLTVSATGTYVSGSTTTGRKTIINGSIANSGVLNFYPGSSTAAHLVWGGYNSTYSGTGSITNNRIPNVSHIVGNSVSYSNPVTISNFIGLYSGVVNVANLTIGNPSVTAIFNTERYYGSFSGTPTFNNTNVTQRNLTYINPLSTSNSGAYLAWSPITVTPGEEIELISGNRWNNGNLVMNTHNNVTLAYPLTVGSTTAGTQNITMTRGVITTSTLNLLILNPSATGVVGATPTTFTSTGLNGGNQGSYVNGPLQIRFPATGTTTRNFPLGQGNAFHTNFPSANVLRTVSLGGTTAWNSQTITASIEAAPSGPVSGTLNAVFGSRSYRLNYNGGNVLGAGNTINIRYNNSTFGGSDILSGNQQDVRIVQAPALTGTWVEKSNPTGAGAMAPNTLYSITSNSTSAGGALSSDQYFAWATVANVCSGAPATGSISGAISSCGGAATTLTFASTSTSLVGVSTQWAASTSSVGPFSNLGIALTQNTGTLASTMFYIVTSSCSISGSIAVSPTYTLQLNPNPTITAVSSSSTYCNPSPTTISLTASGASSYTWSPAASLSSSVGVNVTGTPSISTVYTVVGTSSVGCNSPNATVAISVNPGISSSTITASSASICTGNTSSLSIFTSNTPFSYCQPFYSNGTGFGDYISSVTLSTLTYSTGALATPYYTLYPQSITTTTLTAGSVYTINLQAGTYTQNDLACWIDYNQNGTLEPSEKLGEINDLGATPATGNITFTVPLTALNGSNIRFRVREMDYGSTNIMDPCASQSTFGETEDYEITIVGGVNTSVSYSWSPSASLSSSTLQATVANPSVTTNYSVNVINMYGCSTQTNISVNVDPSPTISITGPATACSGATVNLTANGASTYTWNTGATTASVAVSPSVNTTYTASGTSTLGCVGSNTFLVNAAAIPTVAVAGASAVCLGSAISLTASGATTYTWNTGATTSSIAPSPITNTTYTVTGANGSCTSTATKSVTVNPLPVVTMGASSSTVCTNGSNIGLTGSPTGGTFGGPNVSGTVFTPGAVAGTFIPTYVFTSTVTGCANTATTTIVVSVCTGIDSKTANASALQVYPNPNTGIFTIELVNGLQKSIQVTDLTGRIVLENTTSDDVFTVNINTLANGVYYVKVISNNTTEVLKVVKQ